MNRPQAERKHVLYRGELSDVAAALGRSTSTVSRLISGQWPSKTLAKRFHDLTGFWPHEVSVSQFKRPEKGAEVAA